MLGWRFFAGLGLMAAVALGGCRSHLPQPIDESHEGTLRDGDNIRNGDHFFDEYHVEGVQGWTITVTMASNEFTPKLEAFQPNGAGTPGPETVLGNGTKAELSFVAREGRYNIEAPRPEAMS